MSPGEFRDARKAVGLTAEDLGRLIDLSPRTLTRYETGRAAIPSTVAMLMRILVAHRPVRRDLGIDITPE